MEPQFAGPATHDYSLLISSPCIDAGDPDSLYQDPDGSRNDVGAIPFAIAPDYVCGDADGNGAIDIGDAVYLINYIFKSGSAPDPVCVGDAGGDGEIDIGDAVYLVNFIFSGGPLPADPCCP